MTEISEHARKAADSIIRDFGGGYVVHVADTIQFAIDSATADKDAVIAGLTQKVSALEERMARIVELAWTESRASDRTALHPEEKRPNE